MLNRKRVGLVAGCILGGLHALWSIFVFFGVGQLLYDFILWAHMIHVPITVGPFDIMASSLLILVTTTIGYSLGFVGAWVWNRILG